MCAVQEKTLAAYAKVASLTHYPPKQTAQHQKICTFFVSRAVREFLFLRAISATPKLVNFGRTVAAQLIPM